MGIDYEAKADSNSRRQARGIKSRNRTPEPEKPVEEMSPSELQARSLQQRYSTSQRRGTGWQREPGA
jgi:hypothetical protein